MVGCARHTLLPWYSTQKMILAEQWKQGSATRHTCLKCSKNQEHAWGCRLACIMPLRWVEDLFFIFLERTTESMINPHADDTHHVWSHLTHTFFFPSGIFPLLTYTFSCSILGTKLCVIWLWWDVICNLRLSTRVQRHISIRTALPRVWAGGLFMNAPTPSRKSLLIYWLHSFHIKQPLVPSLSWALRHAIVVSA